LRPNKTFYAFHDEAPAGEYAVIGNSTQKAAKITDVYYKKYFKKREHDQTIVNDEYTNSKRQFIGDESNSDTITRNTLRSASMIKR
jgi:mevalonate kinase